MIQRYLIFGEALIQIKVFLIDRVSVTNPNLNGCLCSEIGCACMKTGCANIVSLIKSAFVMLPISFERIP